MATAAVLEYTPSIGKQYSKVFMGGTFDRLHAGHELLLRAAASVTSDELTIGITDPSMLVKKPFSELIEPLETRERNVRDFLARVEPELVVTIAHLVEPFGPSITAPALDAMVASAEPKVLDNINKIRELRRAAGLSDSFDLVLVPMIASDGGTVASEGEKVSSSELRRRAAQAARGSE